MRAVVLFLNIVCLAGSSFALPVIAPPPAASFAALGLPAALSKPRLQSLIQTFVSTGYGKSFRHLGDERDFDHGHLLFDPATRKPIAILYHTQELASEATDPDFGYVDPSGRNWIQWLDGRGIENAVRYVRSKYPSTATWDWFVAIQLPKLKQRYTIVDKMLDPTLFGAQALQSTQVTFTRSECSAASQDPTSNLAMVRLPDGSPVCLTLDVTR